MNAIYIIAISLLLVPAPKLSISPRSEMQKKILQDRIEHFLELKELEDVMRQNRVKMEQLKLRSREMDERAKKALEKDRQQKGKAP
jgi:hypothetical protein